MAKNNYVVNAMKSFYEQSRHLVDGSYASIGIAMIELGYSQKEVADIFVKSQQIWDAHESNVTDMIKKCEELTGICLIAAATKEERDTK